MHRPQLFCFTYAGGNASFFDRLEPALPAFELVKPEYAGHGTRNKEPFYESFDELGEDLFAQIKRQSDGREYALFGYSMGAVALVEVLKRILADPTVQAPRHVFLAAHEPRTAAGLTGLTGDALDAWVKERTVRFGAVPEKLLQNQSFWRVYLPILRADYRMLAQYRFASLCLRTTVPATVFYAETDTPLSEIKLWKRYFCGRCDFFRFDGTHFFINTHLTEIADVIMQAWENG